MPNKRFYKQVKEATKLSKEVKTERLVILSLARMNMMDRRDDLQNKIDGLYDILPTRHKTFHTDCKIQIEALEALLKDTVNRIKLIEDWQKEVEGA